MNDFIYLKGRDCPICNGARKDCRQSRRTNLFFCRDSEANPPDYIFRGLDPHGFGMYGDKRENEAASEQQREEWRQQRQLEREQRLQEEKKQRSQLLSETQRDREMRKLLAQLDLSPQHRKNLHDRGLNDQQIELGMFRSVKPFQKLETPISHRLAGISLDGRSLTNAQSGLVCPIRSAHREIVGAQLRLDNSNRGRYRWLTSRGEKRPDGATAHLQTGELPITVCRPSGELRTKGLGLAEGFLKPQIAAELLGQTVLGAAGGNFASSPKAVKACVAQLESENEEASSLPPTLYPDAGAITNKNVMRQYRWTRDLFKKLGYELQVAWWGQTSKDHLDIDELLAAGRGNEIEIITWKQFERIAHQAKQTWLELQNLLKGLKQKLTNPFKRSNKSTAEAASTPKPAESKPVILDYVPGKLPTFEECGGLGWSIIRYKQGERKQFYEEAIRKGWKYIIDRSGTGTGKSFSAGLAQPETFGVERLFYFASNHRNPTTPTVEANYKDLPTRNAGMKRDPSRKTPLGKDFIVWPKEGEHPNVAGNCHRQPLFAALRDKNIPNIEGSESPICQTCHLQNACRGSNGDGYGFRNQRREAFLSTLIRAHPDSAPRTDDSFDYSVVGGLWDEAGALIRAMDLLEVSIDDFDEIFNLLKTNLPSIYKVLEPLRKVVRPLLNNEVKLPKYGFDYSKSLERLPAPPENLGEIIDALEDLVQLDLNLLNSTEEYGVDLKDLPNEVKRRFKEKAHKLAKKLKEATPLNWLIPFLRIWNKEQPRSSFRFDYGKLTIFTPNYNHAELARALKFNILLDATTNPDHLALKLKVDRNDILVVEQELVIDKETPVYNNLQVINVTGLGKLGKDRSESLQNRVAPLKKELISRHPDLGIIEWKAQASEEERYWFVDSRGSNEFQKRTAIASFGIPYQNIGHLQALYQALTGEFVPLSKDNPDPGLEEFIDTHVQAEIVQAIGRLRSHIRPNEKLTYYFCADYDLSFLEMPVEKIDAFEITPEAGDAGQQSRYTLQEAFRQLMEAGENAKKITQQKVADLTNLTQGYISQIAKGFGGWKTLKKILVFLLSDSYSDSNNSEPLTDDELYMAQEYLPTYLPRTSEDLPENAVQPVVELAETVEPTKFQEILRATPFEYRAKLISLIIQVLPKEVQQEFHTLAEESLNFT